MIVVEIFPTSEGGGFLKFFEGIRTRWENNSERSWRKK